MRFGINQSNASSPEEIAKRFDIMSADVLEIEARALRKLRQTIRIRNL